MFDAAALGSYLKNPNARFVRVYQTLDLVEAVITEAILFRASPTVPKAQTQAEIAFAQKFYSQFIEPWEETVAAFFALKLKDPRSELTTSFQEKVILLERAFQQFGTLPPVLPSDLSQMTSLFVPFELPCLTSALPAPLRTPLDVSPLPLLPEALDLVPLELSCSVEPQSVTEPQDWPLLFLAPEEEPLSFPFVL